MLMRITKHCLPVYEQVSAQLNAENPCIKWIEIYITSRKSGSFSSQAVVDKPANITMSAQYLDDLCAKSTMVKSVNGNGMLSSVWNSVKTTFSLTGSSNSNNSMAQIYTNLVNKSNTNPPPVNPYTQGFRDASVVFEVLQLVKLHEPIYADVYDSDDDGEDLIGKSICIVRSVNPPDNATANRSYDGIIRSYNERNNTHEVVFDEDNSTKSFELKQYSWKFID